MLGNGGIADAIPITINPNTKQQLPMAFKVINEEPYILGVSHFSYGEVKSLDSLCGPTSAFL